MFKHIHRAILFSVSIIVVTFVFQLNQKAVAQQNPLICQTAFIIPSSGSSRGPFTITLTGCPPNETINYLITFAPGTQREEVLTGARLTTDPNGNAQLRVGHIINPNLPRDFINAIINTPLSVDIFQLHYNRFQTLNPITITSFVEKADCGDYTTPNFNHCKQECGGAIHVGNEEWKCPIPPTPTPPQRCAIQATQLFNDTTYGISGNVYINDLRHHPGTYELYIRKNEFLSQKTKIKDIEITPNMNDDPTQIVQFTSNIPNAAPHQTWTVFVESPCQRIIGSCPSVCEASVTFTYDVPTGNPSTTPYISPIPTYFTPVPTQAPSPIGSGSEGKRFAFNGKCTDGKPGVQTAIGCFPIDLGQNNLNVLIGILISFAIGIAGGIAFLLIIFGGLRIILSSGNPEAMNEGKEIVSSAIAGLMLIIFSVFILRLIGVSILQIPGFS
jgi:hypothetical protein